MIGVGADIIKIPSGEVSNIPLIREVAQAGLPTILSSGMSNWKEIDRAVKSLEPVDQKCLLQQIGTRQKFYTNPCRVHKTGGIPPVRVKIEQGSDIWP